MKKSSDRRVRIVLKGILGQIEPEKQKALLQFLPESEREALEKLPLASSPVNLNVSIENLVLEKTHWSWFLPILKNFTKNEQKLLVFSLDPHAAKNLARELTLSSKIADFTRIGRAYFRKVLVDKLLEQKKGVLPLELLPASHLNPLLDLNKKALSRFLDFLSLHDLSIELRQIVDTKTLKKIYSLLSTEEKEHLKKVMTKKHDPLNLGRLGFDRWDESEKSLRMLLHRRALQRFGLGLSGENVDFIWYICHQLDIGRGTALQKASSKEAIPEVTEEIQKQIIELL